MGEILILDAMAGLGVLEHGTYIKVAGKWVKCEVRGAVESKVDGDLGKLDRFSVVK